MQAFASFKVMTLGLENIPEDFLGGLALTSRSFVEHGSCIESCRNYHSKVCSGGQKG